MKRFEKSRCCKRDNLQSCQRNVKKPAGFLQDIYHGVSACSFNRGFLQLIFRVHGGKPRFEHEGLGDGFMEKSSAG